VPTLCHSRTFEGFLDPLPQSVGYEPSWATGMN
jgi:hypothetical protein